jgi:phosphoribosyl 1,2-cyclic phosphate phosphodiesterase
LTGQRTFVFLGTGTSVGVPVIGCECAVCTSSNPRNNRMRSSAIVHMPAGSILIDTTPEMRLQLLREKIAKVHAVLYTHYHVDHLYGMDDLRIVAKNLGEAVPIHCTEEVEGIIKSVFPYVFRPIPSDMPAHSVPKLELKRIDAKPFTVLGQKIIPIPLIHSRFNVFGFRFDDLAYCTDVSEIPPASWKLLEGVQTLVIDALRFENHPAHLTLNQALDIIEKLKPRRAYLTHMSHDLDYDTLNTELPPGVQMAYDGLRIPF